MDVVICSAATFADEYDPDDYIQIFDGKIDLDKYGMAKKLQDDVLRYIDDLPVKTSDEIDQEIEWCRKMLLRTAREDAEGNFRWHWLLTDTLEIYYDVMKKRYFGPKKALKQMAAEDDGSFKIYEKALKCFSREALKEWIDHLTELAEEAVG